MKQLKCTHEHIQQNATVNAIQSIHKTGSCSKWQENHRKRMMCAQSMLLNVENMKNETIGTACL